MSLIAIGLLLLLIFYSGIEISWTWFIIFMILCFVYLRTMTNNNIHHHDLVKESCNIYTCGGCVMEGSRERYRCRSCNFMLHPECQHAEEERTFRKQKFQLHTAPLPRPNCTRGDSSTEKYWRCEACEKKVKGFLYHCPETDVVFHPFCFPELVYNPSRHNHGLVKDETCKGNYYTCSGCKMKGVGPRFSCSEGCDDYNLHHECMFAPPELKFQKKKCHFYEKPPRCDRPNCTRSCKSCDACGKTIEGFYYHCPSNKEWNLHPCCAKLQSQISIDDVKFLLDKQGIYTCAWCNKKRLKDAGLAGWSYVSKHIDYSFHVYCIMEMTLQCSSTTSSNNTNDTISNGDSSLALVQGMKLPLKNKSKNGGTYLNKKWLKRIIKFLLKSVMSVLLGDHFGIITASTVFSQFLFHQD